MRVRVTQQHIDRGEARSYWACPIALALNEQHPREVGWYVGASYASVGGNVDAGLYRLPLAAKEFLDAFDAEDEKDALPFCFELEAPNADR